MTKQTTNGSAERLVDKKSRASKTLLAAACGMLGAGTGLAEAGVVSEPPDFSTSLLTPTVLPVGTNQVSGHVSNNDRADTVRFDDLGGAVGTITFNYDMVSPQINEYGLDLNFYNSSQSFIGGQYIGYLSPLTGSVLLNVPIDGVIIARVYQSQDDSGQGTSYTLGFDVPGPDGAVPAPASGALTLLGAAALFARRRRKPRDA